MRLLLLCQALREFLPASEASGESVAKACNMRGSRLWQGGSKGHSVLPNVPKFFSLLGWRLHTSFWGGIDKPGHRPTDKVLPR